MRSSNGAIGCYDLCCGAGILSLGFMHAGFKLLGGIDIDQSAIETVSANLSSGEWERMSIERLAKDLQNGSSHPILHAGILLAGLPCQGFSIAGKRDPGDERNNLYRHLVRIAERVRPKVIVFENVRGLQAARNKNIYVSLLRGLRRLGYDVDVRVYDAVSFGTPQRRSRVFVVAANGIEARSVFESVRFAGAIQTVKEALKGLPSNREVKAVNHTFMNHGLRVQQKIRRLKGSGVISYRLLSQDEPATTIISGHNALPVHPKRARAISIREAARLQGIPDSYVFSGARTKQTLHVANAVPFPMALAIARAVKKRLHSNGDYRNHVFSQLKNRLTPKRISKLRKTFVNYYRLHGRKFPWRKVRDPRIVLLTELLLQRTKAKMVADQWPKVQRVLNTSREKVAVHTQLLNSVVNKLGIFRRTIAIRRAFAQISTMYRGIVPKTFEELRNLSGVGIYVASAVRTFAHGYPDFPVDGNAFRFLNRFCGLKLTGRKTEAREIREFMNGVISRGRPKEFAYGFLDFAAEICSPRSPNCGKCSLKEDCRYYKTNRREASSS